MRIDVSVSEFDRSEFRRVLKILRATRSSLAGFIGQVADALDEACHRARQSVQVSIYPGGAMIPPEHPELVPGGIYE